MIYNSAVTAEETEVSRRATKEINEELNGQTRKYFVEAYGCQMNEHDAENLRGMLDEFGYTEAYSKSDADFIIFNTCCVREHAELRVFGNIGALKKLKDEKPGLIIGVCGCMMQQREVAERLYKRFPFVDIVFGTHELHLFPQMFLSVLQGERVFAVRDADGEIPEGLPIHRGCSYSTYVNIMYGCNNFCTYCIVPYVRGRERSRDPHNIIDEIQQLAQNGYKEITLLGQNVNSYSYGDESVDFPKLLSLVNDIDGIERIRFMTSHPKDLSPRLIEAMASLNKVCNHIHLPVQSGSDRILREMNRRYDRERYFSLVDALRSSVKDIEITTDMIVGFPTETDEDFNDTLSLVERVRYSAAYTFMYSPRHGTKAALMDGQIPQEVKKERLHTLNELQARLLKEENEKFIGKHGTVLVEGCDRRDKAMAYGKLTNFKMVYFPGDESLIGSMRNVKVECAQANSLLGVME